MLNTALENIEAELQKNMDNRMMIVIGDYLTDLCKKSPVAAQKVSADGKDMKGALSHLRSYAQKQAVNSCAAIADDEAFNVIREYYGIGDNIGENEEIQKDPDSKIVSIFDVL